MDPQPGTYMLHNSRADLVLEVFGRQNIKCYGVNNGRHQQVRRTRICFVLSSYN